MVKELDLEKNLYEYVVSFTINHYLMRDLNINFMLNNNMLYNYNYFLKLELEKKKCFLESKRTVQDLILFDNAKYRKIIDNKYENLFLESDEFSNFTNLANIYYKKLFNKNNYLSLDKILKLEINKNRTLKIIEETFLNIKKEKLNEIHYLFNLNLKIYLKNYLIDDNDLNYYRLKIVKHFLKIFRKHIIKMIFTKKDIDDPLSVTIAKLCNKEIEELIYLFTNNFYLVRYQDMIALLIYLFYDFSENNFIYYLIQSIKNKKVILKKIRDYM